LLRDAVLQSFAGLFRSLDASKSGCASPVANVSAAGDGDEVEEQKVVSGREQQSVLSK